MAMFPPLPPITIFGTSLSGDHSGSLHLVAVAVGRERIFMTEGWLDNDGNLQPLGRDFVNSSLPTFVPPEHAIRERVRQLTSGMFAPPLPMPTVCADVGDKIMDTAYTSAVQLTERHGRRWHHRSRSGRVDDLYDELRSLDAIRGCFPGRAHDEFVHQMMMQPIMEHLPSPGSVFSKPDIPRVEITADSEPDPTFDPSIFERALRGSRIDVSKIRGASIDMCWADEADEAAKADAEPKPAPDYPDWGLFG